MSTSLTKTRALVLLGGTGAMEEMDLFVGREGEINSLITLTGKTGSCRWIHGPARNGKSSLARLLGQQAAAAGKRVAIVDGGAIAPGKFDELLAWAVQQAGETRPAPGKERDAFTSLAASSGAKPLLLIFDEFDRHAIRLGLDEQAFLRTSVETYRGMGYLFVTRLDPARIVEDVADERSRLLGICGMPVYVPILSWHNVRTICERVADACGLPDADESWAARIWEHVGGHTASVVNVLHRTVANLDDAAPNPLDAMAAALDYGDQYLRGELRRHWWDVTHESRAFLLGEIDDTRGAERDGYWNRITKKASRPQLLLEAGKAEGLVAPISGSGVDTAVARAEHLHDLIYAVNIASQRAHGEAVFAPTNEQLHFKWLVRPASSQEQVSGCVNHLAKILYEGGRNRKSGAPESPDEWRLPPGEIRDEFVRSPAIRNLKTLRNYYDHDERKEKDREGRSRREREVGAIFEEACGTRDPRTSKHWTDVRGSLLNALIASLGRLREKLDALPPAAKGRARVS